MKFDPRDVKATGEEQKGNAETDDRSSREEVLVMHIIYNFYADNRGSIKHHSNYSCKDYFKFNPFTAH